MAITALESYHWTLFSKMFLHCVVRIFIIWSAEALVEWSRAFTTFNMSSEFGYSEDLQFLESSTPMCDFNPVNNILQNFWLDTSECIRVFALTEEADNSVALLCCCPVISCEARIANYFCAMSTLFRIDRNLQASSTSHQFSELFISKIFVIFLWVSLHISSRFGVFIGFQSCLIGLYIFFLVLLFCSTVSRWGCLRGWWALFLLILGVRFLTYLSVINTGGKVFHIDCWAFNLNKLSLNSRIGQIQIEAILLS